MVGTRAPVEVDHPVPSVLMDLSDQKYKLSPRAIAEGADVQRSGLVEWR